MFRRVTRFIHNVFNRNIINFGYYMYIGLCSRKKMFIVFTLIVIFYYLSILKLKKDNVRLETK